MSLKYYIDSKHKTDIQEIIEDVMERDTLFNGAVTAMIPLHLQAENLSLKAEVAQEKEGVANFGIINACNEMMISVRKGMLQAAITSLIELGYKITLEEGSSTDSDYALAP